MAFLTRLSWRFLYCCALFFVSVSVVYTTNILFITPLLSLASKMRFRDALPNTVTSSGFAVAGVKRAIPETKVQNTNNGRRIIPKPAFPLVTERDLIERAAVAPTFDWVSNQFTLQYGLGHIKPIKINEKTILSKAFSSSARRHPSNVLPYFYRASGSFDQDDITITTLITSNRFEVFARLVKKYRGPISVTVHIKDVGAHLEAVLESLHDLYTSSDMMMTYVDVHLVVDSFDRQFNTWRNIARLFARTEYVMMLDIDFYPCTDFRDVVRQALNSTMLEKLNAGRAALVIPAFEYSDFHEGTRYVDFPSNKTALLSLVERRRVRMFHASWAPGHNSTDYEKFYAAPPGDIYAVMKYQPAYEPYVIFKKTGPPWCDERFVGYGGNKAACLFEMYLSGISYYVLTDHFIIHQNHLYEETARKNERRYNRKVYLDFREETCIRYLKRYRETGLIDSDSEHAVNALTECKKMKPLARFLAKQQGVNSKRK